MGKYIRGDVTLAGLHLKKLPEILKDLTIEGSIFLNGNSLTTLENFPELVTENIMLGSNPLVSLKGIKQTAVSTLSTESCKFSDLEGCPSHINKLHIIGNSNLKSLKGIAPHLITLRIMGTQLQSMEYCNQNIHGTYQLQFNALKSLVGMPKQCRTLTVGFNQLENFIGAPEVITEEFNCQYNPILSLEGFPRYAKKVIINDFMKNEELTRRDVARVCETQEIVISK
jgi:hypothetical protein